MHADGRVNVLHRAVEAERSGAADEDLAPFREGNGARDLLDRLARHGSDEHAQLTPGTPRAARSPARPRASR